ncbi:MAG: glycosyltransferase family 4 protein [Candidatus Kryptoniota bacterium]
MAEIVIVMEAMSPGGAEIYTCQMAKYFAQQRSVIMINFGNFDLGSMLSCNYKYPSHGENEVAYLFIGKSLRNLGMGGVKKVISSLGFKPSTILFSKSWLSQGSLEAELALRLYSKRYVVMLHSVPQKTRMHRSWIFTGFGIKTSIRMMLPHSIICVSHAVRTSLETLYMVSSNKLRVVPNGVDTQRFRKIDATLRRHRREKLGIEAGAFLFGIISRLSPEKGIDTAIECFSNVVQSKYYHPPRMLIVGDGPERPRLENMVDEMGIGDLVKFLPFTYCPEEIFTIVDVVLVPSRSEGLPLTILEAFACEVPVIAFSTGGISEIFQGMSLGWLCPAGDRKAFLSAMADAITIPKEMLVEYGKAAREHVLRQFNLERALFELSEIVY